MANEEYISLRDFPSFGDVAAEEDAVLDYFLSTNAVDRISSGEVFLALGRKGTGKTALVRYFTESRGATLSKSLSLRGYPWSVHARRIDAGASEIEAYVSSWRYLIAVELASLVLAQGKGLASDDARALANFLADNYGGPSPQLTEILRPQRLKLGKMSLQPQVMGSQLGGVELERGAEDHRFGLELNAVAEAIMKSVAAIARTTGISRLSLHFDELDQGLAKLDEQRSRMLIGLVLAARELRRDGERLGVPVSPVVYLRSDIWDELQFSDKNKITNSTSLNLAWTSENLQQLVEARLRSKLRSDAKWEAISEPALMRGSQKKWNHIIARTFLRPRDVIQFLNIMLARAKQRGEEPTVFTNQDIIESRDAYSTYLKEELNDEIRPHWEQWEESLQALSAISTITFERSQFDREYQRRRSRANSLEADEALAMLYRFSVIGYESRSGYGGSGWVFQYTDPQAGWDSAANKFKVHPGLKEYAKLSETRG